MDVGVAPYLGAGQEGQEDAVEEIIMLAFAECPRGVENPPGHVEH